MEWPLLATTQASRQLACQGFVAVCMRFLHFRLQTIFYHGDPSRSDITGKNFRQPLSHWSGWVVGGRR